MNKRQQQTYKIHLHITLIAAAAGAITLWGLMAIYRTLALNGSWSELLGKQSLWALTAWSMFFVICRIRFSTLMKYCLPITAGGVLLLLLLPLMGNNINGMSGWFKLGGFSLQPSELLKVFYILTLVHILHLPKLPEAARVGTALGVIALFVLLLLLQPDFGTMIIYLTGGLGTLYFCRVKFKYLLLTALAAVPAAISAIMANGYMRKRLLHFFCPELDPLGGSWHLHQFTIAVSRGEWTGVKGDMAVWSNSFLPLAYNDSIFAGLCEMLGFCGAFILLMLYAGLFRQMFALGAWRRNSLRRSAIDSLSCMLMMQTMLHIAVNLGLLPPTGITLPLVSYGGSSLVGVMLMLGTAVSAGRQEPTRLLQHDDKNN
ncbi:MAG: hypothetical protein E7047_02285 [Lentisphaerae bacterium]|nr:hypothetical protein [Lentisphaerota bacterium]